MDLIGFLSPKNVVLVHGEKPNMSILKGRIQSELGIPCFDPANNESVSVPSSQTIKVDIAKPFLTNCSNLNFIQPRVSDSPIDHKEIAEIVWDERTAEGILLMEKNKTAKFVSESDLLTTLGAKEHTVQLAYCCAVKLKTNSAPKDFKSSEFEDPAASPGFSLLELLSRELKSKFDCSLSITDFDRLELRSFQTRICVNECCCYRIKRDENHGGTERFFCCSWLLSDDVLARKALSFMKEVELDMSNEAFLIEM